MVTDQMSGGTLISFIIYELELGECLEVRHDMISLRSRCLLTLGVHFQMGPVFGSVSICFAPQSIASVYTGLMQGVGAAEKVFEYIDRKPKHTLDGQEAPDMLQGLVEFKNITFAYPTRPETDVLKVSLPSLPSCST